MKLRLFTIAWNEPYLTWFEQACVRSLCWPDNLEALRAHAVEWNIYTREGDIPRLRGIAERAQIPLQFHPFDMKNSSGETLQPAMVDHMRNCLQVGAAMFVAPPDTIFGEGSVKSICAYGQMHGICVAVPHVRMNAGAWNPGAGGDNRIWSNAELVDHAFANLHRTWQDANALSANNNSLMGGVSWRELAKGLYGVQHRLPTCYLANVDASDLEWFSRQWETGTWDHTWPAKMVKEQRQRTIASSDAAFIVELTRENDNIPPVAPCNPQIPDAYWRDLEHHYVNRNVVSVFKGVSHGHSHQA